MILKFLAGTVLAASLCLGGCTTTGQNVNDVVREIQSATQTACGFLPAASTITGIIATLSGQTYLNSAVSIAGMICNAVNAEAAKPTSRIAMARRNPGVNHNLGTVNGVKVVGKFTRSSG